MSKDQMFEEVFDQNYEALCLFANTFLNDICKAEDLVQEVFIKWFQLSRKQVPAAGRSYLYKMTRNACIDSLRRRNIETVAADHISDQAEYFFQPESDDSALMERLLNAVDSLPEKARRVFVGISVEGRKYQDMADEMNVSINTIKTQLSRSLKLLRERLDDPSI